MKRDQNKIKTVIDDMILTIKSELSYTNHSQNLDGLESELSKIRFGDPNGLSLEVGVEWVLSFDAMRCSQFGAAYQRNALKNYKKIWIASSKFTIKYQNKSQTTRIVNCERF